MAPPVEARTKRSMPACRADSSRLRVPPTLTPTSKTGSDTERRTPIWAARWKTTSGCRVWKTSAIAAASVMSASTSSAPLASAWSRFSRRPVDRSSTTTTGSPRSTSASTRWEPMKPAPPVTRAFMEWGSVLTGGDGPELSRLQQCDQRPVLDRGQGALLQLDPGTGSRLDRAREVKIVADQQDVSPPRRQLDRVEVAAAKLLGLLDCDAQLAAGDAGHVPGTDLGARQTGVDADLEGRESAARSFRLPHALLGQPPRVVVLSRVLGVSMPQQPDDHDLESAHHAGCCAGGIWGD